MEVIDSANKHELEETSSYTRHVKKKFSHRWTIEDFSVMLADTSSEYPLFKSALFSSPFNSEIKFAIYLFPKGKKEDSKDYLSIFLHRISPTENEILAKFSFYLIDSEGVKRTRHTSVPRLFSSISEVGWGWFKYLQRTDLLDPLKGLLNEDRLIIYCEVTLFDGTFTVDTGKYMPNIEELKVLSKKQSLMDLTSLLECDKQTDVTVVVGGADEAKEIKAHKFVLIGGSSVFEEMFENDPTEDIVSLSDVSVEGGELFIRYLYTGNVAQLETYAEELFVLADKYDTDLLKQMCVQYLCSQMSTESVCHLLLLSDRHSSTKLQNACIEYITNHAKEVILNEDWQLTSQLNDQLKVELFRKLVNKHPIV